jgi:5-methylcytosine-specific restriction endonuclease McrA
MEKRTYRDRAAANIVAVTKRRKKLKRMAVELMGGKCSLCGYHKCIRALEFHHLDPLKKEFALSTKGLTRSWDKIKEELLKTVLLCANCHREVEDGLAVPAIF